MNTVTGKHEQRRADTESAQKSCGQQQLKQQSQHARVEIKVTKKNSHYVFLYQELLYQWPGTASSLMWLPTAKCR